jgi:1-acyl-sn-glycerol-3-phosphate acyltransferase
MTASGPQTDGESEREGRRTRASLLYAVVKFFASVAVGLFFRLKVKGAENVPRDGGVLIASNHQSFLDPIIVTASNRRPVSFMARDTLFRIPLFGRFIMKLRAFPVRRGGADRKAVREAVDRLKAGEALLVFPEGTRTRDGRLGRLRSGTSMLAYRARAPIVPAAIKGAFEAWPRTRKLFRFRPISITYGRPIAPPERSEHETHEEIRRKLQDSLESLMEEA